MRVLLSSIILSLFLISCSTGKKAYERGDYYQATLQAVNRLRGNPDSEKALDALSHSYPSAIKYFQEQIDFALSANRPFKYSEIVDYYQMLNNLGDEISRCPAAMRMFPDVNLYAAELAQAKQNAAEEQYIAGLANEKQDTRLSWKSAYFNFQQADCFVPGYKDVRERMGTAKFYATWKVIVEQIQVPRNYQLSSDFFLNQVVEYLTSHRPNEFVEYYSPQSAEKAGLKMPDQVLRMNFDEFIVGQVYDKETIRELSKDSVVVGNVTMPDGSVKNVYNTVKAKLITYRREVSSNGVLDVTIIDWPLNNIVSQRKFPGQFVWSTEWSTFQGDERALNRDQLALCDRKPVPPPPPQNLFIEFTKPIFNQVTPFLQDFYRKY